MKIIIYLLKSYSFVVNIKRLLPFSVFVYEVFLFLCLRLDENSLII